MKILILILSILFFACIKDEYRKWQCTQRILVFREKCGVDTLSNTWIEQSATDNMIIDIQHKWTYKKWGKKEDLKVFYPTMDLPDSLWVESSCNCDVLVCI
jgi:hypothetical protein